MPEELLSFPAGQIKQMTIAKRRRPTIKVESVDRHQMKAAGLPPYFPRQRLPKHSLLVIHAGIIGLAQV